MADQKTTADLRKAAEITDDEINAAVDAVLAKPDTGSYPIGGHLLDLVATEAHVTGFRSAMIRTATLPAQHSRDD